MNNREKIKQHLLSRMTISTIEAFYKYNICHLAKYIQLLKKELIITDRWVKNYSGKRYKIYSYGGLK